MAIAGGGVRDPKAVAAFRQLCSLLRIPHTMTIIGLGAADPHDSRSLGMVGMHGTKAANLAVHSADVLLASACASTTASRAAPTASPTRRRSSTTTSTRPSSTRSCRPQWPCTVIRRTSINALIAELQDGHVPRFDDWAVEAQRSAARCRATSQDEHLSATDFLDRSSRQMPAKPIVATDVGQHQMWSAQRIKPLMPRNFAPPPASARWASVSRPPSAPASRTPARPVFAICGDGGFQMTMLELATVKRYQVPVKIVIIDNRNLGMVRQWQELFYDERYSATNLSDNPDFCTIASAYDIEAFRIKGPEDAAAAARRASRRTTARRCCTCRATRPKTSGR